MNEEDHAIINRYGAEYRGIVQYYLLAGDVYRLDRLHWVMGTSLLKTLAGKYGSTVTTMAHRYRATIETPHGPRKCLQARVERSKGRKPLVAKFGGIPLRASSTRPSKTASQSRPPAPARADQSAPKRMVRALRTAGRGASSPDPQARRSRPARDARSNPSGQGSWPNGDARPSWSAPPATPTSTPEANRVNHGIVAGEPGDRKRSRRVCARHDQQLGGASPLWRLMAPTTSRWQPLSREAGWGGSRSAKSRP